MKMLKNWRALMTVALSLAFVVACTKKRDAELPYGADRDLLSISDFDAKEYDLQTLDLLKPANSGAELKVQDTRTDTKAQVKNFDYVSYKAQDPLKLTDDTLMLGRPQFKYKLKYVFEGNLLKVMKLSKPEDLATDEIAVAADAGDGRLMVPVVSYNVSYFSIDTTRNDRNEKTSKLELVPQNSRSNASHFKIDPNTKARASFISKATVLPADFFVGAGEDSRDWYFAFTITAQNFNESRDNLGAVVSSDKYGRAANKVRAKRLEDKIVFYNLAIDSTLGKTIETREENQSTVISLPVEFIDYRFAENGKTTSVKEESHKERAWDKRSYMDLKLKDTKVPGFDIQISEIKDVQIADGYFSFNVISDALGGTVRFAFYNVKAYQQNLAKQGAQPYKPKIYFPQDKKLFGFFDTTQEIMDYYQGSKQQIDDRKTFINRFNPTRREIEFRINEEAPEWIEEVVVKAVAGWNATFKAAGSQVRLRAQDENGKVLRGHAGDLRYSLINMYTDVDGAGPWGGFGPVLTDPQTGEIIMATANMNITDRVDGIKSTLNAYILARKGALDDKYVMGVPLPSLRAIVDTAQNTIQYVGNVLGFKPKKNMAVYDPIRRTFRKDLQPVVATAKNKLSISNQYKYEDQFDLINGNISAQVEQVCPELKTYAESLKDNKNSQDLEREMKLVNECSIELAKPVLLTVMLHEMGHNMGLRHNFYGSADKNNFYAPVEMQVGRKKVKTQWVSSTVMDYVAMNFENMSQPGLYDIAAIRWGYTDQVETSDGKVTTAKSDAPTTVQMKGSLKKYMYCTDEDTDVIVRDPMCARMDIGTNPVDVIKDLINQYNGDIALRNNRLGRVRSHDMMSVALYRQDTFLKPMKRFYEQWRNILAAQAGPGSEYLEAYDMAKYQQLVKNVLDPKIVGKEQAERNKQYKDASDLIFGFLMRMAFLPDYSCIADRTINGKQILQMFSFSKLQKVIYNATGHTVTSCQDSEVRKYLKDKKQANVDAEAGYAFENLYADLSVKDVNAAYKPDDKPEVTGLAQDRYFAMVALVERTNELYLSQSNQFAPNFVDEPPYRLALNEKIMSRLAKGVALQETGIEALIKKNLPEMISPSFETEKPLLALMLPMFKEGLAIPDKLVVTNQRLEKFGLVPKYYLRGDEDYVCVMIEGYDYCATDQHSESKKLVAQLKELETMKAALKITDEAVAIFLDLTKDLVPAKGHGGELDITFFDKAKERILTFKDKDPAMFAQLATLADVFKIELNVFFQGTQKKQEKLDDEDLSKKDYEKKIADLKKTKIKALVEKLGLTDEDYKALDQETLQERVKTYVDNLRAAATQYEADPTELDSQADLILSALTGR